MKKYLIIDKRKETTDTYSLIGSLKNKSFSKETFDLVPGAHVIVLCHSKDQYHYGIYYRLHDLEYRDEISILGSELTVLLFRSQLEKTVAENSLKHGAGGLNIDQSRIPIVGEKVVIHNAPKGTFAGGERDRCSETVYREAEGRFPANIILLDVGLEMDEQSGLLTPGYWTKSTVKGFGSFGGGKSEYHGVGEKAPKGGASRFFFNAKNEEDVVQYLTNLIKPK